MHRHACHRLMMIPARGFSAACVWMRAVKPTLLAGIGPFVPCHCHFICCFSMNCLCQPILRSAGRLDILEVEPSRMVHKKQPPIPARLHSRALERSELRFRHPQLAQLVEDWNLLAHARRDAASLTALLRIMALVPSAESCGPRHAPRFGGGRDMRPWLADRAVLRGWLVEMSHLWFPAIVPLVKERILPAWADQIFPAQDGSFCPDVHLMARCGEKSDLSAGAFEQRFARHLLPFAVVHKFKLQQLRGLEATWLRLLPLLQVDARLCLLLSHGEAGLGWMKLLMEGPVEWLEMILCTVLQVDAHALVPDADVRSLLETLRHYPSDTKPAQRLRWAFQGLVDGAHARWLAGTYRMARTMDHDLPACRATPQCPSANRFLGFLKAWDNRRYLWWGLWLVACQHHGFWQVLSQISRRRWDEETGLELMRWLTEYQVSENEKMDGRWAQLRAHWHEILRLVRDTPKKHREEVIAYLRAGFSSECAEKDPDLGKDMLRWAQALHWAREFSPSLPQGHVGSLLPRFQTQQRRRLLKHAARLIESTKKLDRAYTFESHLSSGAALIPLLGRETITSLLLCEPRGMVKALALLGHLGLEAADRVCKVFVEHPLVSCKAENCSIHELVVMVESNSHGRRHGLSIRTRLRRHLDGTKILPPHLLTADRVELLHAWARLTIEVLEELVERELRLMFPIMTSQGVKEDVLMFLHTLDRSQRKGRELVRRSLRHDAAPKLTRPGNKRWMATLDQDMAKSWIQGLVWNREVPEYGVLRLELETDPIEVLWMGEYGNSCLSKGGCCQYSALTNALEANKQVIYARNTSGRVVARQVLALSEQRTLVCCEVYPRAVADQVKALFAAYDRAFAELLGLRIDTGNDYTVAAPLGLDWYDDGAWEEMPAAAETVQQ